MKRLYRYLGLVLAALGISVPLIVPIAQPASADEAGAISLTIPPNVRGEGMGGLFLTTSNNYSARWSNPASLGFMNKTVVGGMLSQLVPDLADDV